MPMLPAPSTPMRRGVGIGSRAEGGGRSAARSGGSEARLLEGAGRRTSRRSLLLMGAAAWPAAARAQLQAVPLTNAHAHNDYEHPRPLLDALDRGFCSVEADIHLVEGRLLVAHDRDKVRPERTLE